MKLTNLHGLPETISRAMIKRNEMYNAGKVDTSVTQLIQPPQITILRKKHFRELSRDMSEEFWALLGSGVHSILELGATENMVVEERLFATIDDWRISGAIDVQEFDGKYIDIFDYKTTSVYSVSGDEPKTDYVHQLNMYAMLVELNKPDYQVRNLNIVAVLRDWSGSQAKRDPFYPQAPIQVVPIPLWSRTRQLAFARERIVLHREARFAHDMDDDLPECSADERWVRGDKWAVMKGDNKKATKVFGTEAEALALIEEKGTGYSIDYRPGASTRCGYCGVADWCSQYARMSKDGENERSDLLPD
jgi:hypothetical protein